MEYVLNFKKNNFFNIINKVEIYKKVYNKNSFNLVYDKCYLIWNNNDYLFFLKRMTNLIMLGNSVTIKGELNRVEFSKFYLDITNSVNNYSAQNKVKVKRIKK